MLKPSAAKDTPKHGMPPKNCADRVSSDSDSQDSQDGSEQRKSANKSEGER